MPRFNKKARRRLRIGLSFLAPNIIGFLTFTLVPLVFSMVLAFSNWDLRRHNMFKAESVEFVGIQNFIRLINEGDFLKYLGNTLFLMMKLPLAMAGSLGAALLLSKSVRGENRRVWGWLVASSVLVASVAVLAALGLGGTAFTLLLVSLAGVMLVGGTLGGSTVYRTLFFLPHFTSGVAVFILWKKMYNPETGPINNLLKGPLEGLTHAVNATPSPLVKLLAALLLVVMVLVGVWSIIRLRKMHSDGDVGMVGAVAGLVMTVMPYAVMWLLLGWPWLAGQVQSLSVHSTGPAWLVFVGMLGVAGVVSILLFSNPEFHSPRGEGFGTGTMFALVTMVVQFILLGLALSVWYLPGWAAAGDGLTPPQWLNDYDWAKPAIMIMALWGAIGSNNMLLYLAGLSNIPTELYEAADLDGASPVQRFWHVTWPQLAPVTFFIFVMSVIGGLQGGFEMARTMTKGGPAGSTTTMSYFIYSQGFQTGRLGYASAVAWALFALVFVVTLFNWKFGSRYVNE